MFIPVNTNHDIKCEMHNVDSIRIVKVSTGGTETVVQTTPNGGSASYTLNSNTPETADYYCRGTKDGNSVQTSRYTYTVVNTNVISGPTDQFTIGESVKFECLVPAGTTVSFKKTDNNALDLSTQTSENSGANGNTLFTLTISNPIESDNGEYFCEGNNGRSSGAMLNYVRILSSPKNLYRDEGQAATFVCKASGYVSIKWTTPTGFQTPDHTFVTETGDTIAEHSLTAEEGGIFYCVAADIISSESAKLVVMKVQLIVPDAVKSGEEVEISCVVFGDHDGVTISNEGRMLTTETPLDAMSTMAKGGGTNYFTQYEVSLSLFTEGVTNFACTAYYNNFGDVHKEEGQSYFVGFYKQPSDIVHLPGTFNIVAQVSSSPKDNIVLALYDSENTQQDTKTVAGGSKSVSIPVTRSVASTGRYYYEMKVGGETIKSDQFTITTYGAPIAGDYEIYYPGSKIDSLTLICVLRMPLESPVTWTDADGDKQGSDNPLISTKYSGNDQIMTSTFTISAPGTGYSCSATILETPVTVGYKVYLQNYALVPEDKNNVFYDTMIQLKSSPASFNPRVFAPDKTEINLSQPLKLYESRDFTSELMWTWGDEESLFIQSDTLHVAGIYIAEPGSAGLVAGEDTELLCTATQTADIFATRIKWTVPDGTLTSNQKTLSLGSDPNADDSKTTVTWRNSLTSGSMVTITCTVDFSFKDGSPDVTKVRTIVAAIDNKCTAVYDLNNGVVTASGTSIFPGETASVKCNDGYQLSGQSEYRCSGGVLWSSSPKCVEKKMLCPTIAPTSALVNYDHPDLTMQCIGDFSAFRDPPRLKCEEYGWNLLSVSDSVSSFQFCGEKITPYSKSVTLTVTYGNGDQDCNTEGKKTAAFLRYQGEVNLGLTGITETLVGCNTTPDGYALSVSWFKT